MELLFLGTSSMVPTKDRNHSSILLSFEEEGILIDCGEGTQRQLRIAGIKSTKVTKILISHWHGDHVLGIPGLIQTMGANEYTKTLKIYGPPGTRNRVRLMQDAFVFEEKMPMEVYDIEEGLVCETDRYRIDAYQMDHSVECIGFTFYEKPKRRINLEAAKKAGLVPGPLMGRLQDGLDVDLNGKTIHVKDVTYLEGAKKIGFITDTAMCNNAVKLAEDCDLLVCEATYTSALEDKAEKYKHLTAKQAAFIANKAEVKKLVLNHFSQRYKSTQDIEEDARELFNNIICAKDFMSITL